MEKKHWKILSGSLDTHCHLNTMKRKKLPVPEILTDFFAQGGSLVLDIGTGEEGWEKRRPYSQLFPGRVFHTQGIHPTSLPPEGPLSFEGLQEIAQGAETIAWGEIGLDYYHKNVPAEQQKKGFREQLALAEELKLPVIIHNREADADLFSILDEFSLPQGGILHCFSSGPEEARKALNKGLLLGINGNATYKGSDAVREAVRRAPLDCLVPDTDAPFLSPLPARGRPNHQGHIHLIYQLVADLKECTPEEAVEGSRKAWRSLFPEIPLP